MRLARLGYRSAVIDSTTLEEAPGRFCPWLRQRTRWLKDGCKPGAYAPAAGPCAQSRLPGFIAFQLVVGGNAWRLGASAVHGRALIYYGAIGDGGRRRHERDPRWLYGASVAVGYLASALSVARTMRRGLSPNDSC